MQHAGKCKHATGQRARSAPPKAAERGNKVKNLMLLAALVAALTCPVAGQDRGDIAPETAPAFDASASVSTGSPELAPAPVVASESEAPVAQTPAQVRQEAAAKAAPVRAEATRLKQRKVVVQRELRTTIIRQGDTSHLTAEIRSINDRIAKLDQRVAYLEANPLGGTRESHAKVNAFLQSNGYRTEGQLAQRFATQEDLAKGLASVAAAIPVTEPPVATAPAPATTTPATPLPDPAQSLTEPAPPVVDPRVAEAETKAEAAQAAQAKAEQKTAETQSKFDQFKAWAEDQLEKLGAEIEALKAKVSGLESANTALEAQRDSIRGTNATNMSRVRRNGRMAWSAILAGIALAAGLIVAIQRSARLRGWLRLP